MSTNSPWKRTPVSLQMIDDILQVANVPCIREPQRVDYLGNIHSVCVGSWGLFVPVTSIEKAKFSFHFRLEKSASIRACYPGTQIMSTLNPWVPRQQHLTHNCRTRPARPPAKGAWVADLPCENCSFNVPNVRPYPKTLTHPRPYAPRQLLGPVSLIGTFGTGVEFATGAFVLEAVTSISTSTPRHTNF
jgi:hypothetical protein